MSERIEVNWNPGKSFVCVDYPAVVVNVDKMLDTLGGTETLTKIYNNPALRLPLRFRPDDVYGKPLYGDKVNVARILLKVRRPKVQAQQEQSAGNPASTSKCQVEMLGIVDRTYKFKSMADFQYLVMVKSEDGEGHRPIYDEVVPTMMHPLSWLNDPVPMFLPPIVCSRMDTPCDYDFRKDVVVEREREEQGADAIPRIGHNRRKRCGFAIYAKFDQENMPEEPLPGCLQQIRDRGFIQEQIEELREIFKSRPVWSKLAVKTQLKSRNVTLSFLLPAVAFYMVTGPWRTLWVRYGYDPRKEPTAKIYQMIDLRLKKFGSSIPLYSKWRGNVYGSAAKISAHISDKVSLIHKEDIIGKDAADASGSSQLTQAEVEEKSKYSFYDGVLPNRRQSILQFCDIYIDEVQRLIHENDGREDRCAEKDGWFSDGFAFRCRQLLFNSIESSIASTADADTAQTVESESRNNNDSEQSSEDYEDDGE